LIVGINAGGLNPMPSDLFAARNHAPPKFSLRSWQDEGDAIAAVLDGGRESAYRCAPGWRTGINRQFATNHRREGLLDTPKSGERLSRVQWPALTEGCPTAPEREADNSSDEAFD